MNAMRTPDRRIQILIKKKIPDPVKEGVLKPL
jgi:hypothetical protein